MVRTPPARHPVTISLPCFHLRDDVCRVIELVISLSSKVQVSIMTQKKRQSLSQHIPSSSDIQYPISHITYHISHTRPSKRWSLNHPATSSNSNSSSSSSSSQYPPWNLSVANPQYPPQKPIIIPFVFSSFFFLRPFGLCEGSTEADCINVINAVCCMLYAVCRTVNCLLSWNPNLFFGFPRSARPVKLWDRLGTGGVVGVLLYM